MLDVLQKAARAGGEILLKYFRVHLKISYKTSHQNLLTNADILSQEAICKTISTEMENHGFGKNEVGFISEENLNFPRKHTFVIDPLDGTTNFASGLEQFGISIAYFKEGILTSGLVYQPAKNVFYLAELGKGSFVNSRRLKINSVPLNRCLTHTFISTLSRDQQKSNFKLMQKLFPKIKGLRINGCASLTLCQVAENIFNLNYEFATWIWDIAAAKLIITEAGGGMFDYQGKPLTLDLNHAEVNSEFIACHPKLLQEVLTFFS